MNLAELIGKKVLGKPLTPEETNELEKKASRATNRKPRGVRHGHQNAGLIKACAAAHRVSDRAVRNWRDANDQRWLDFLSDTAINKAPPSAADAEPEDDQPGEGLDFEIMRLKKECVDLARRTRAAGRNGSIDLEAMLHRMLDQKRETLRKLAKDDPDIARAAGDVVPKIVLAHYAADISTVLNTLPARIATLMPADSQPEVRQRVQSEIDTVLQLASQVEVRAA